MKKQTSVVSISDFHDLVQRVAVMEQQLQKQNGLYEENQNLKEENQSLNLVNEHLQSRLEQAEWIAIWDQDSGEIVSIADWQDRRE